MAQTQCLGLSGRCRSADLSATMQWKQSYKYKSKLRIRNFEEISTIELEKFVLIINSILNSKYDP